MVQWIEIEKDTHLHTTAHNYEWSSPQELTELEKDILN